MRRPLTLAFAVLLALLALLAGCGGDDGAPRDPVAAVPDAGLRDRLREAGAPRAADFPPADGPTLQELADAIGTGPAEVGLATSRFTVGPNRLAFGVIDDQGQFVYGRTAVYVARSPSARARGPYPAPADLLVTDPPFRSRQAASEEDPFAAVYAAQVPLTRPGRWSVLVVTERDGRRTAAASEVRVITKGQDRIPDVGEPAPRVQTDTLASVGGNERLLDTRVPPSDLHARSFSELVGKQPVALLFATPQLCQSRVCGPVVDVALQLERRYGDRVAFIHQEVYEDNRPPRVREPLRRFQLPTEPWLFVVDREGRVTARLEGSFGLRAFEAALRTAL